MQGPAAQASGSKLPRHRGLWWIEGRGQARTLSSRFGLQSLGPVGV